MSDYPVKDCSCGKSHRWSGYSVWPSSAPPVCIAMWTLEDHNRFEAGSRPKGYDGCAHDVDAFAVFRQRNRWYEFLAAYAKYGMVQTRENFIITETNEGREMLLAEDDPCWTSERPW